MMKKKLVALLLLVVMLGALVIGCGKKAEEPKNNNTTDNKENETKGNDEVVTLKWIMVGNGMPTNYDAWKKHINEYLAEKIGVNIEVEVVAWGDWDNRRNVIVNSGEYFDILFTDSGRYLSEVDLGAFYDMTDLVQKKAPDLYNYIPADYWDAVKVDGKIYSVPTYKDSSMTNYFVWDTAIADKYDINIDEKHTLQSLSDDLKKIKDGEGKPPFILDKLGASAILSEYDAMGAELVPLGVRIDDESRTVVNVLKEDQIMRDLKTLHEWYKEGIINADAPTLAEVPKYRMCFIAQGWPSAAKTTWGPNMGADAKAVEYIAPIVSNSTVRGSLNAIYSGCKHPDKAMEFLQLVNMDPYVRDAFYYGLEGENFNYTEDGKVDKLNSEWNMAGYTQGTFFNVTQLADEEFNQWDEVKELNTKAKGSVLLGFDLDQTNIQNELANCREIWNKYKSEVLTGARDAEEIVNTVTKELEDAGFNKIMEEAQKQINEQFK
ncbi:MAG TPA: ABC transporter substrate-binding protein [Lachnospiraceae bacterium]|nr:ABC transporter substrate-binding protein [Lachnospiraceae bacterium]HBY71694.1 ABC transporter substrate-binding protein [Lachnospiraceae bacterium]HCA69997.1 ABC transporter substrate-binding protein [Lachnospiraceae bacterium]HCM12234.1 ABC transporter substrate-binding protein [Lachnospiraceae bacterium]HCR39446.1 ABC transporter substrate-binding protein [Lachnospiraceae bacterium]